MAEIDSRIALGFQPVQVQGVNPLAAMAQMAQIEGARSQNRLAELALSEKQAASDRQRGFSDFMRQNAGSDAGTLGQRAIDAGYVQEGLGLQEHAGKVRKASLDARKTEGEIGAQGAAADKARLEGAMQRFTMIGQIMSGVRDQASYDAARQQAASLIGPEAAARMPAAYDPAQIESARMKALPIQQQIEAEYKAKGYDLQRAQFGETQRHNRATEGLGARNAAAREAEVAMGGKPPPGYRWGQGGVLEAIPGGPGDPRNKGLNDGQANAGNFAGRMAAANDTFDNLAAQGVNRPSMVKQAAESVPLIGGALGMAANAVAASPEQQQVEQAQRDFINATLRRESGAAISAGEFANANQQYFPQPGDSPQVIAQKRQNRARATASMLQAVPEAFRGDFTAGTSLAGQPLSGAGLQPGGQRAPAQPQGQPQAQPSPGSGNADPLGIRGGR